MAGANGRMGKNIIKLVGDDPDLAIVGAVEHPECPVLGADAGLNSGTQPNSVSITTDLRRALDRSAGVVIDFSSVQNTLENLERCIEFKCPIVIGTTGFDDAQKAWLPS